MIFRSPPTDAADGLLCKYAKRKSAQDIEAPAKMRAEFKLYLKDLRFVGDSHLSLPLES